MALFISLFLHCLSVLLALTNFANAKSLVPCYFIFGDPLRQWEHLSVQLKALYNNGARKIVVYAIGQLGCTSYTNGKSLVPCYFFFGDSLSDNGNNNHLSTLAKVDFSPYGINFPKGPTGRFSNGRTMHDFIVGHLGFKVGQFLPPYANTTKQDIRKGVNYASGSAGIRDETGKHLYYISLRFTLPEYTTLRIEHLSVQLKALYNNGAKKIVVYAIGQLGCTPYTRLTYRNNRPGCVHKLNKGANLFHDQLRQLVNKMNYYLSDATFTCINPQGIGFDLSPFEMTIPCCQIGGEIEGGGGEFCLHNSTPCRNRKRHIFWDGVYLTEAWNEITADIAYSSPHVKEAHSFNIKQLAMQ